MGFKNILILSVVFLCTSTLFSADPADENPRKRLAEQDRGPATQIENKSRKVTIQSIPQLEKKEWQKTLFTACYNNNSAPIVKLLQNCTYHALKSPFDVNEYMDWSAEHITPFGIACLKGTTDIIIFLLDMNADPNKGKITSDKIAISPLDLIQQNTKMDKDEKAAVCKLLRSYGAIK